MEGRRLDWSPPFLIITFLDSAGPPESRSRSTCKRESRVKKRRSVTITASICPTDAATRRGKPFRSRIEPHRRCVRNIYGNLRRYFPRARCSLVVYTYMCNRRGDVHECTTLLPEEATRGQAGSDVISVTRLRDWRDVELKGQIESRPDTSPLPSRVLSNNRCCCCCYVSFVRLELERVSARVCVCLCSSLSVFLL